ncbi:MAG: prephenate dehydrogenase/arogenate dehydrogenase family protein [Nitrospirae bacterium]|nr:MAG: prephenate dehydrogenase/arogenate dehydrogenase family protein [Nitrospirota bacterium]
MSLPMRPRFEKVAIVGVGLIGGSLGMILKREGVARHVVGIGRSLENLQLALSRGAIDSYEGDPSRVMPDAELVILATPVESYASHVRSWGKLLKPETIVTDVGSVKGQLVEHLESLLPPSVRFVGGHPIAGKEQTGVGAGSPELFRGALCILTPTARTDPSALQTVETLWQIAGSTIVILDPFLHDWVLGAVSHLPHIVAFALMTALEAVQQRRPDTGDLLQYAGGGLRDTTRIAGSSPEMWRDILLWNRENVLALLEAYECELQKFKRLLANGDAAGLEREITRARDLRRRLP